MIRREFIALIGVAAAWPSAARAQQPERMRRAGILWGGSESEGINQIELATIKQGLAQLGWSDGRNIRFDIRFGGAAEPQFLRASARELVALPADLLMSSATPQTAALHNETRTIPIVFLSVSDPIGSGFAANLAHPGGNMTGFTNYESTVAQKWLELLKEIAPNTKRVGVLFNPSTAVDGGQYFFKPIESAARILRVDPIEFAVHSPGEIEGAISKLANMSASGLIVLPDSFLSFHHQLIISLTLRNQVPAFYGNVTLVRDGGLIGLGIDRVDQARRAVSYVDRILKGQNPADLPVQAPVKFELVINLKTAKAMRLDVPLFLQQRADEVIE